MSMRIGGEDGARWAKHIAGIHLKIDSGRLAADVQAGADERTIAADKEALRESRRDIVYPRHLVDVTV
ncbi:hypothetical protein ACQP2F_24385 [Actinoplanes sp. CA-030573]|uniref:hypothetical protein n=1 Tax=Actinoplanes sp. CA-030573 TaxID=3239898 RepID=UPI003D92EA48